MTKAGLTLTRPLRVTRLSNKIATTFDVKPDASQRAALAMELGISAVERMVFRGTLTPVGRHDFTLQATLAARVVQPCVVTLQPVVTEVSGKVLRRYLQDYAEPKGDEAELQDDTLEPLGDVIDPGQVAIEALALLLPEYPRAAGASFVAPVARLDTDLSSEAERPKPFAVLADLAAKLAGKPPDPDETV